ncbi:MAG TPA: hypothetical protein VGZ26_05045, partial [Pirellulales bacterium]|nr:hypothetical protein [Pirellulales bacterium]
MAASMTYEESVARLVNHANLPSELPEDESWGVCLFKASSTKLVPPIDALMLDVIGCLDVVNKELNGAVPSKRGTPPRESIATILAYAMSCIIEDGIEKHRDWGRRALFDQRTLDLL